MSRDDRIDQMVDGLDRELYEDVVELWIVVNQVRRTFPEAEDDRVRAVAEQVVQELVARGAQLGDYTVDLDFVPWPDPTDTTEVATRWRALGRDPNFGEVACLDRPSSGTVAR